MSDTVQAIARSLSSDVKTLDSVGHNVANMHTPGYRAIRAVPEFGREVGVAVAIDQRDGALQQTGNRFDLALRGPGFFAIERDGRELLVRSGAFRIDAEGRLVTAAGEPVLGEQGPIVLDADAAAAHSLRVERDGSVYADARPLGQLRIVAIADAAALRPAGTGAYVYEGAQAPWTGSVIQGAIERANVDAAEETVRLMELTRHAESVQRAISIYDKAMDTGINQIGGN